MPTPIVADKESDEGDAPQDVSGNVGSDYEDDKKDKNDPTDKTIPDSYDVPDNGGGGPGPTDEIPPADDGPTITDTTTTVITPEELNKINYIRGFNDLQHSIVVEGSTAWVQQGGYRWAPVIYSLDVTEDIFTEYTAWSIKNEYVNNYTQTPDANSDVTLHQVGDLPSDVDDGDVTIQRRLRYDDDFDYVDNTYSPYSDFTPNGQATYIALISATNGDIQVRYNPYEKEKLIAKFGSSYEDSSPWDYMDSWLADVSSQMALSTARIARNAFIKAKTPDRLTMKNFSSMTTSDTDTEY